MKANKKKINAKKIIKEARGIAILAHPQTLKLSEEQLKVIIKELKEYGLDGVECYHSKQTEDEMTIFKKIAEENDLLITKGSDYHGESTEVKKELGTGINNNIIINTDDELLEKLIKKLKN